MPHTFFHRATEKAGNIFSDIAERFREEQEKTRAEEKRIAERSRGVVGAGRELFKKADVALGEAVREDVRKLREDPRAFAREVGTGVVGVAKGAKNLFADIARDFPRAVVGFGLEVEERTREALGQEPLEREITPEGKGERFFLGEQPIVRTTKRGEETLTGFGVPAEKAKEFGLPTGLILGALDITLPGVQKIGRKAVQEIAERYGDDIAKQVIKLGDKKVAERILKEGDTAVKDILKIGDEALQRAKPPRISPDPLAQARKAVAEGKTAEEFVKAQGTPLYHRTSEAFDTFDLGKKGQMSRGIHFDSSKVRSDAPASIERFGKNQVEAYTNAKIADVTARVINDKPSYSHLQKELREAMNFLSWDMRIAQLKKLGYGGYKSGTEVVVFNPKNIKTKSQLITEFNKAKAEVPVRVGEGGVLADIGVPKTPQQATKALSEVSKVPVFDTPAKAPDPSKFSVFQRTREKIGNAWDFTRENVQDDMLRVKKLVDDPKVKITPQSDPYQAEILFHGRVGSRVEDLRDTVKRIDQDIVKTSKAIKVADTQFTKEVNDFLVARHAPERNAQLFDGAAGITTKDANARISELNKLPYSKELRRIADQVQEMNNRTLEVLKEGEVIDDTLYDLLRKKYKNHIPLQRIMNVEDDFAGAMARGFEVRGTGIQRAKGSEREVADVMGNVSYNLEQAIIRAEKNRVDLSTLKMVRDNKATFGDLIKEVKPPRVPVARETFEKDVDIVLRDNLLGFAKKLGVSVEDVRLLEFKRAKAFGVFQQKGFGEATEKLIKTRFASAEDTLAHELGHAIDSKIPQFREVLTDSRFAEELKRVSLSRVKDPKSVKGSFAEYLLKTEEQIAEIFSLYITDRNLAKKLAPKATKALDDFVRNDEFLSELSKFAPSNVREILEFKETIFRPKPELLFNDPRVLSLREKGKPIFIEIADPELAVALRGVARQKVSGIMRGVASISRFYSGLHTRFNPEFAFSNKIRDLQEALVFAGAQKELGVRGTLGVAAREARGQNLKSVTDWLRGVDTEGSKLYQQMRMDGGTTGGLGLSTRKAVEIDIEGIRKLNRSNPRAAAEKAVRLVDDWNTIFEDSTRLSVYREALKNGASRERAARLAKESSVNFNKFGKQGPLINALYIFSNASIQGSTKMILAMKNPKVAATVVGGVTTAVAAAGTWNDKVDPEWREKVPLWDRLNSLIVMIPSDEGTKYLTVPVSWGIKPIKVMADQFYDVATNKSEGLQKAMAAIMVSVVEGYNPVGGTDMLSAVTPTILDMPFEIARNQAWHGGKIRPDWDKNAPPSIQYFSSLRDRATGRIAVGISKGLSGVGIEVSPADMVYGYEQVIGGVGRAVSKTVNTITAIGKGEEPLAKDIPVVSRFFKSMPEEETGGGTQEFDQIQKVLQKQSVERFNLRQQAEDSFRQLSELPQKDAAKLFLKIKAEDEELADKVAEIKKEADKGITFIDRQILALGVTNGERAKFVKQKLDGLETNKEKARLWKEYVQKGIISKNVDKQLREMLR